MHTLIPDELHEVDNRGKNIKTLLIGDTRNEDAGKFLSRKPTSTMKTMFSMGVNSAGALALNNHPDFMLNMKVPRNTDGRPDIKFDLGAVDVLRDRERLTPRYNDFREKFHLPRVNSFEELFNDPNNPSIKTLKEVYGGDIDKMDLLVGTLAEETPDLRYPGFAFGNTPFYMFALMASRRLMGDPFFSDYYTPEVYTELGLCWIEKASMKSVLLRHFPELIPAMEGITNAFRPWKRVNLKTGTNHRHTANEVCLMP